MKRKWICLLCALALALPLAGCGGGNSSSGTAIYKAEAAADMAAPQEAPMTPAAGMNEMEGGSGGSLLPADGRKIILNADLTIEALDFDATCSALLRALQQAGGYVASTNVYTPSYEGAQRSAHYQLRVPAAQYDSFLSIAGGAGNLVNKQESTEDVTSIYVDVEARLKSLRLQEERLFAMMEQAGELETLLAIQNQLAEVQYQIESYTGQKRTYDDLTAYSTVNVYVEEVRRITEKAETFGGRIADAFTRSWSNFGDGVQDFAVGFVAAIPTLLVLAVLAAIAFFLVRAANLHHRKAMAARPAPKPYTPASYRAPDGSGSAAGSAGRPVSPDGLPPVEPKYK